MKSSIKKKRKPREEEGFRREVAIKPNNGDSMR